MGSKVHNTFQDASDPWKYIAWDLKAATSFCPKARARLPENLKVPQKIEMGKIWEDLGKEEKAKKGSTEGDDWKDTMRSAQVWLYEAIQH